VRVRVKTLEKKIYRYTLIQKIEDVKNKNKQLIVTQRKNYKNCYSISRVLYATGETKYFCPLELSRLHTEPASFAIESIRIIQ